MISYKSAYNNGLVPSVNAGTGSPLYAERMWTRRKLKLWWSILVMPLFFTSCSFHRDESVPKLHANEALKWAVTHASAEGIDLSKFEARTPEPGDYDSSVKHWYLVFGESPDERGRIHLHSGFIVEVNDELPSKYRIIRERRGSLK